MKVKYFVCKCVQCRFVKRKRKNRKLKIKIKRLTNKKIRKSNGEKVISHYWS